MATSCSGWRAMLPNSPSGPDRPRAHHKVRLERLQLVVVEAELADQDVAVVLAQSGRRRPQPSARPSREAEREAGVAVTTHHGVVELLVEAAVDELWVLDQFLRCHHYTR